MKVTVDTIPWSDFQTKAFTEFNSQGSAYDLVVGDSQWIGAASDGRPLCRADRLRQEAQSDGDDGSGDDEVLLGVSGQFGQVLVGAAGRRRRRLVLPQGLVRRSQGDGGVQGQVRLRSRRAEGPEAAASTSPSSSIVRPRTATAPPSIRWFLATPSRWARDLHLLLWRLARRLRQLQGHGPAQLEENRPRASRTTRRSTVTASRLGQCASSPK